MHSKPSLLETAGFLAVLAAALIYASAHLPAASDYRLGADEGIYFRQALTVRADGPRGFVRLADEYVRNAGFQIGPPPLRIGHLLPAAAFLAVRPSMGALSVLSIVCYVLLCVAVFLFVSRLWDGRTAVLAGICAAVSPLGWGLALRALMDTDHALFSTLALFTLLLWLATGRERHFVVFAAVLTWSLLVKETAWIYVPFAVVVMVGLRLAGREAIRTRHVLVAGLAIPAVVGLIYVAAFGGPGRALSVIQIAHRANVSQPNAYLVAYGSGPWYEYVVDFLLLSPVVTMIFLMFCGRTITGGRRDQATTVVLLFACYVTAALAFVAKNPRFALPLDPVLRLGAAAMIAALGAGRSFPSRALIVAGLMSLIVVTDARAFQRYFVRDRIYDPVAATLLSSAGFLPSAAADTSAMSAEALVNQSLALYRLGDFRGAIRMAEAAIAIQPNSAEAYNNIGAAYCELQQWQDAIPPLETALRLRPDFPTARNNLAWARSRVPSR